MSLPLKALKKAEESHQGRPAEPNRGELAEERPLEQVMERPEPGQSKSAQKNIRDPAAKGHAEGGIHNRLTVMLSIGALLFLLGGSAYVYIAINPPGSLRSLKHSATAPITAPPSPPVVPRAPLPLPEDEPAAEILPAPSGPGRSASIPEPDMAPPARVQTGAGFATDGAVKVSPGQEEAIHPELAQAWQALQDGRLETARALYQRLLQEEPRSVDILLGLAAVMARSNAPGEAGRLYLRTLDIEPGNIFAQAGLLSVLGEADPAGSETRLKQLLAEQPAAFLYFVLGNLYAARGRWSEAQQAYFEAHRLESDNPDYAFNLAVGLERISQPNPALTYYQRALVLQQRRSAGFERAMLEARIAQLQGVGE